MSSYYRSNSPGRSLLSALEAHVEAVGLEWSVRCHVLSAEGVEAGTGCDESAGSTSE